MLKGEKPSTTGLEQQWDYLYVDDLIEAFILLGEKGIGGKVYPIGSGEHKQMREYVETIRNIINPSISIGIGEMPYKNPNKIDNQIIDVDLLYKDTGFKARYDFRTGIENVINSYMNNFYLLGQLTVLCQSIILLQEQYLKKSIIPDDHPGFCF